MNNTYTVLLARFKTRLCEKKKNSISYYVSSTRYSVFEVLLITDSHRLEVFYCFLLNTDTGYIPQLFEYTNKQFNLRD